MECAISKKIDYLNIPGLMKGFRSLIHEKIKSVSKSDVVHPGLPFSDTIKYIAPSDIPGVLEAGWVPSRNSRFTGPASINNDLQANLGHILKAIISMKDARPFSQPVDPKEVTDYYSVIHFPMGN